MLVTKIWSMQPGKYFCLSTRAKGKMKGGLKDHWFERYQFHLVAKRIKELRSKYHVWFCAHGFKTKVRQAEVEGVANAEQSHFFYADLDSVHPSACPVKATMAVESSRGRYVGYWYVGEPINWADNQAWTKLIGADPGGWDPTQVLRAPTSLNHKYGVAPRVKTLWEDGPQYALADLRKRLPRVKTVDKIKVKGAAAVYKKWESLIPAIHRPGILAKTQTAKDRSEWMWRVGGIMMENGIPLDDIFTLLWNSGNNKYFDKKNGEAKLRRELDKKLESKMSRVSGEIKPDVVEMFAVSMDQVEQEDVAWEWEPYVARGEVTIMEGDPGIGKSYLVQMIAIAVADGTGLPGDKRIGCKPRTVFFFDHENSRATVMKPRLVFNGLKNERNIRQDERAFSVDDEDQVKAAHAAIVKHNCGLVIFDTLMNYAGGANTHSSAETARIMGTFRDIAIQYKIPVIVLRHLTKDKKTSSAYRGQGSITFTGSARTVIGVGYASDDVHSRFFKITKSNLTDVGGMPARRMTMINEKKDCRIEFGGTLFISNDDLYNTAQPLPEDNAPLREWLKELLNEKPMLKAAVIKSGKTRGYDATMIETAGRGLIRAGKLRKGEPTWELVS